MSKLSINPNIEGVYSRKSVQNGDENIYLPRDSRTECYSVFTENILFHMFSTALRDLSFFFHFAE